MGTIDTGTTRIIFSNGSQWTKTGPYNCLTLKLNGAGRTADETYKVEEEGDEAGERRRTKPGPQRMAEEEARRKADVEAISPPRAAYENRKTAQDSTATEAETRRLPEEVRRSFHV